MSKILIIDDSKVMRELLETYLIDLGYDVVSIADGHEALNIAATEKFDICICDMHLEDMSGYDVLCKMKPKNLSMQMIFTDSLPDNESAKISNENTYNILQKPFDLEQLKETIEKVIETVNR